MILKIKPTDVNKEWINLTDSNPLHNSEDSNQE